MLEVGGNSSVSPTYLFVLFFLHYAK
jgi:hypothetical protein